MTDPDEPFPAFVQLNGPVPSCGKHWGKKLEEVRRRALLPPPSTTDNTMTDPDSEAELDQARQLISEECDALKELLLAKNKAYGNSALNPARIFSKASTEEQILVRIDDKLNRILKGSAAGEDVVKDLLGYLILLRVARRMEVP